tara:strand:- start:1537 stop:1797 length:261 start_codon:yes stop_codon:yes gene_type:complete
MSPLLGFLVFIVLITAFLVAYLTKQFQKENLNYSSSNLMSNSNKSVKTIEKEKVVAETLNGRFAMIGLIAALGAYLTTGQIIPGFV